MTKEPRKLLKTAGLEYVPAKDEEVCYGFGGSCSVDFPEISAELPKRKLDNVKETGAGCLVADCPGRLHQLRGGIGKWKGLEIRVHRIAGVVADRHE